MLLAAEQRAPRRSTNGPTPVATVTACYRRDWPDRCASQDRPKLLCVLSLGQRAQQVPSGEIPEPGGVHRHRAHSMGVGVVNKDIAQQWVEVCASQMRAPAPSPGGLPPWRSLTSTSMPPAIRSASTGRSLLPSRVIPVNTEPTGRADSNTPAGRRRANESCSLGAPNLSLESMDGTAEARSAPLGSAASLYGTPGSPRGRPLNASTALSATAGKRD